MPRVDFEPMIPVSERAKMVHALDRGATVIGVFHTLDFNKTRCVNVLRRHVSL
jgi:hypothetical protein